MTKSRHLNAYHEAIAAQPAHTVNVNTVHQQSLSRNDRVAIWISDRVGTLVFCYAIATTITFWAVAQLVLGWTAHAAFDAYPFPFLFFCLGGIMQSLLMPLIMVAQNVQARHADLRAEADFTINQDTHARLIQLAKDIGALQTYNDLQERAALDIPKLAVAIVIEMQRVTSAEPAPPPPAEKPRRARRLSAPPENP